MEWGPRAVAAADRREPRVRSALAAVAVGLLCGSLLTGCLSWPELPDLPRPGLPKLGWPGLPGWLHFGGEAELEPVDDGAVLRFAARIEAFYRGLEAIPLDVLITYENPELREHFVDEVAFGDYYASLAYQVRRSQLRNSQIERFEIRDFHFESDDVARVELILVGRHQRTLRFWELELARTDTWRRVEGSWVLSPEKL